MVDVHVMKFFSSSTFEGIAEQNIVIDVLWRVSTLERIRFETKEKIHFTRKLFKRMVIDESLTPICLIHVCSTSTSSSSSSSSDHAFEKYKHVRCIGRKNGTRWPLSRLPPRAPNVRHSVAKQAQNWTDTSTHYQLLARRFVRITTAAVTANYRNTRTRTRNIVAEIFSRENLRRTQMIACRSIIV